MKARFWGTRGSLPTSLSAAGVRAKIRAALGAAIESGLDDSSDLEDFIEHRLPFTIRGTYGGNSSCVEIIDDASDEFVLCDAGTGLREFGGWVLRTLGPSGHVFNVVLSHLHWDHIMGLPLFAPAYIPGNTIRFFGCHAQLEQALRAQQGPPSFPVPFENLGAAIEFHTMTPGVAIPIGGLSTSAQLQDHEGDSYGYRFESGARSVVYTTDAEHRLEALEKMGGVVAFFREADLVIFDAMYSLADAVSIKEDWGHSSNIVGVDLCHRAGVRHYCMYHHEPVHSDETIERILAETRRYEELSRNGPAMDVSAAHDGLVIEI